MHISQKLQNGATRASANSTPVSAGSNPRTVVPIRAHESKAIEAIWKGLPKEGAHYKLLNEITDKVDAVFGQHGVTEFFRGAHMVFDDEDGAFLEKLLKIADPLAARHNDGNMMSKIEAFGDPKYAGFRYLLHASTDKMGLGFEQEEYYKPIAELSYDERMSGKMVTREAGTSETSHYSKDQKDYPELRQYGVDMPGLVKGHILFGKVPGMKKVFIQSEGAGFQTLTEHVFEHGKGAFWSIGPDKLNMVTQFFGLKLPVWQTGMAGCTEASEKNGTHYEQGRDGKLRAR